MPKEMKRKSSSSRRSWTPEETKTLLECYINRKPDLNDPAKKKNFLSNLLEDLERSGVLKSPLHTEEVSNRIKSLRRAYRKFVSNDGAVEIAENLVPYIDLIEITFAEEVFVDGNENVVISVGQQEINNSLRIGNGEPNSKTPKQAEPNSSSKPDRTKKSSPAKSRTTSADDKWMRAKIALMRESEVNRMRRHREREAAKERRHEDRKNWHNELMQFLRSNL